MSGQVPRRAAKGDEPSMQLKIGARFRSQVCSTELIVVRSVQGEVDLTCGGQPVIDVKSEVTPGLTPKPGSETGSELGKRYTDEEGKLELLVTKAGNGGLALDGAPLSLKGGKPLPASD